MSYSNGFTATYHLNAQVVSGAATLRLAGPNGAEGRLIAASSIVTTNVTVAPAVISIGSNSDPDAYGVHTIPISSAGAIVGGFARGVENRIPADSEVQIDIDGGPTAGAASITVLIEWYGGDAS